MSEQETKQCEQCGDGHPLSGNQRRFCSTKCGIRWHYQNNYKPVYTGKVMPLNTITKVLTIAKDNKIKQQGIADMLYCDISMIYQYRVGWVKLRQDRLNDIINYILSHGISIEDMSYLEELQYQNQSQQAPAPECDDLGHDT